MPHREQARGGAVAGIDFGIDVLDMVSDRLCRHDGPLGDFLGRQRSGDQTQDVHLAGRQARDTLDSARDAVACPRRASPGTFWKMLSVETSGMPRRRAVAATQRSARR